ncbi:hypothetical protein PPERSA_12901 [Pseudocohnilembus persalinus]|uniref:Uncharacterized protein n=1 Tax=Pseudocohnilembus persalinus TaxID=266149 RepID=A0A0V0R1L6_PSEPJ|nr:hypothetical protein PPERSA_12901 [Pseudocohnilembus persalinus]|eukprot:KRX08420.1 hypothetical protein PPERSA_12901 [Pseudocohnilembus persalinus]
MAQIIKDCVFCQKYNSSNAFKPLLTKALYSKYSSSQNYFYLKDINELSSKEPNSKQIALKDQYFYDDNEEYLKRIYEISEYDFKIKALSEYYKYHKDIPRNFLPKINQLMNYYHDKKRKIEYAKIKKALNLQTSQNSESSSFDSDDCEVDSQGNKIKPEKCPPGCEQLLANIQLTTLFTEKSNTSR